MSSKRRSALFLAAGVLAAVSVVAVPAAAQNIQGLPRQSPRATVSQTVGIAEVTVDYHRPSVNGREIWGGLVPYGAVWRAGANDNTTVTFSHPVRVEGKSVAAGTYGLHMFPGEDTWEVALSTNHTSWGSFSYDPEEDAARVEVQPEKAPFHEHMLFAFEGLSDTEATLALYWEELRVPVRLEFDTPQLVVEKIRRDLRHIPGFSWEGWNSAAAWCLRNSVNLEEALEWAERSISINRNGANVLTKAALLEQLDRGDEAAATEAEAIAIANEAQINNLGYDYLLRRNDVEGAIRLFQKNIADYPDSWNVYDSLGEALAVQGETGLAIENYTKALGMAPENQKARIQGILDGLKSD